MTDLILTESIIKEAATEATHAVRDVLSGILSKVILYGSCARGDFHADSDVDIALIMKCSRAESKKFDDALARISTEIAMKCFAIVNFVCIPETEFLEKKTISVF